MLNSDHDSSRSTVLATDLDGTLIPLADEPENITDLEHLKRLLSSRSVTLVFVTGRDLGLVQEAIEQYSLPTPDWVVSDVGTSIYRRQGGSQFVSVIEYARHLAEIIHVMPRSALTGLALGINGLQLQENVRQAPYKISFYADADRLRTIAASLQERLEEVSAPWQLIDSVDPFTGDGLIDVLPSRVSKAYALEWWAGSTSLSTSQMVFAGDSGNDLAVLTSGCRSIIVGNASDEIIEEASRIHQRNGWSGRLYVAAGRATSGVLEGCHRHQLFGAAG